ncbi:MAG: peroxiredoxin family protein [Candidatus Omnitrophota bacterium]|nr:peroxiredoxin family protein [Candidatus Omnitrophota bacterium]
MKHHNLHGLLIIMLILTSAVFTLRQEQAGAEGASRFIPETGNQVPDFALNDFNGGKFVLSEPKKDTSAILLWFTNLCGGCQMKLPEIEKVDNLYKEKGVEVIAISVLGEDRKTVENIIREKGITFRFLYDPQGEVTGLFSGEYYPGACPLKNIFLIDRNRKIIYVSHYPGIEESELIVQLEKIKKK